MTWASYIVATLFCLLGLACVLSIILGLPGTWIMIGMALITSRSATGIYLPPGNSQTSVGG